MNAPSRTEKTIIGRWWWSVDHWTLSALGVLMLFGVWLVSAASPSVAERIGLEPFYFVWHHVVMLVPAILIIVGVSVASRKTLWRMATLILLGAMVLMVAALFSGIEIKGATRWVRILGFSIQPSEFAKPAFAVTSAWLMARHGYEGRFPGHFIATGLCVLLIGLLMLQPDFGMSVVMGSIWAVQIFMAGLPLIWVVGLGALGVGGVLAAYFTSSHVASRIDRFLDPSSGDNYQVHKSLAAFSNGGLFGTGPGHGQVKMTLPDAHADFIFSVAGEELGLFFTLLIIITYVFIVIRSIMRVMNSEDLFILLGSAGLITQFALQSLVHMGSSLQLLPAKGMTLPFISYGGSSLLALGIGMGMLLSLTRKRALTPSAGLFSGGWAAKQNYMTEERHA